MPSLAGSRIISSVSSPSLAWLSLPSSLTTFSILSTAQAQGLTLVHFLAQRKRVLWSKGGIWGLPKGCLGGIRGYHGVLRVYFVSGTAQVELKSERV